MKIHEIRLKNFRKFIDERFHFNTQTNVTVLIGDNATGKSAILDALSIMMGSYLLDFKVPRAARHIRKNEIRLKQIQVGELHTVEPQWSEGVSLSCLGSLSEYNEPLFWSRELTSEIGKTTRINAKNIAEAGKAARLKLEQGEEVLLPILAYYGTGRLWHKLQDGKLEKPDSRSVGYRDCLASASNHHLFLKWFSRLERASLQKRKTFGVIEAVRKAVKTCITDCENFFYDMEREELMIELTEVNDDLSSSSVPTQNDGNTQLYSFENLSDGYRNMLAMVADIAHRAARLNPHLAEETAMLTPGVVLIDEVDLHLHPKWQRSVMHQLRSAFPNVQFIVTTHSPFIIQSLKSGEVIDLNNPHEAQETAPLTSELESDKLQEFATADPAPSAAYCDQSIEDIVENVMGVPLPSRSARLQKMYDVAKQYYDLLEQASPDADDAKLQALKVQLDELSSPFSEHVAYHAFLERKRLKMGVIGDDE